jgi:hypothetical protein
MTEFETKSIAIAGTALNYQFWSNIVTSLAFILAAVGAILAFYTLRTITKQLESARWNSLLSFEADLAARRDGFHEIAHELDVENISPSFTARLGSSQNLFQNVR